MSENVPKPSIVSFVVTYTSDIDKSINFWKDVIGFETPYPNTPEWASLHAKGSKFDPVNHSHRETSFGIHLADNKKSYCTPGNVGLNFVLDGIDKFHDYLVSRGDVEVLEPPKTEPWGGKMATYRSPDGVVFGVVDAKTGENSEVQDQVDQAQTVKKQKTETTDEQEKKKEPATPSPFGICHIDFPVGDLKRAEKFYTDAFGWKFQAWKDDYSLFDSTSKEYPLQGGFQVGTKRFQFPFLYISTPSIKQGVDKLKSLGAKVGEIVELPQVGFTIDFEDSEGNVVGLYSRQRE